eukprot:2276249-Alexandrium_andersonii.AAC.1
MLRQLMGPRSSSSEHPKQVCMFGGSSSERLLFGVHHPWRTLVGMRRRHFFLEGLFWSPWEYARKHAWGGSASGPVC